MRAHADATVRAVRARTPSVQQLRKQFATVQRGRVEIDAACAMAMGIEHERLDRVVVDVVASVSTFS